MSDTKSFIVAVTGASGAIYATRTMRAMLAAGNHVHLVLSKYGRYVMHEELGWEPDNESILDFLARTTGDEIRAGTLEEHGVNDLTRAISSGSSPVSGMVVVPCSAKSLAAIAHGTSSNLIERSAGHRRAAAGRLAPGAGYTGDADESDSTTQHGDRCRGGGRRVAGDAGILSEAEEFR